jgi:PEP-CTERM putative exosortase interaction domain
MSFTPVGSNTFLSGSLVDLGSFVTQCVSCTPGSIQNFPSGVLFTLTINQTNPSGGTGSFLGSVSGTVSFNPSFSSLVWMPSPNNLNIGLANYALVLDNTGNFNIEAPITSQNPNATVVKAFVTTTPEPSTMALMATGIVGLVPVIRRRRRA